MMIEELVHGLSDTDAELRRRAVLMLRGARGQSPEQQAELGRLCIRALGDVDWRVRKEAVDVLSARALELGLEDALVAALSQGDNVGLRNAALDVISRLGGAMEAKLVAALGVVPEPARKFVVEALGDSGSPRVVPALAAAARDGDVNVASEAIEALSRIGGRDAETAIRGQLKSGSALLRVAALEALNRREAVVPWDELAPLLEDAMLRRVALSALGRTGRMEALAPLFAALAEPSSGVVARAVVSISALLEGSPSARHQVDAHIAALSPGARASLRALLDPAQELEVRRAAVELLLRARDEAALPLAVEHLAEDAASPAAVGALRAWGKGAVEPLLALSERHPSPVGRATALELAADLALIDDPQGYPEPVHARLVAALSDLEPAVAQAACRCLGEAGGPSDVRALCARVPGASPELLRQLTRALSRLAERFPAELESSLPTSDATGASGVAFAGVLASMGEAALPRLQVLFSADDADVRRAAVQALGRVGGERASTLVPIALADESPEVQVAAAHVLGGLRGAHGAPCGVDDLLQALRSPLPQVQAAAARALGQSGSALALEPLRGLLTSPDAGLAVAAVEALGALSPPHLAEELEGALRHADSEVVKAALAVLALADDAAARRALEVALAHGAWDVRKVAATLLADRHDPAALAALRGRRSVESDPLVSEAIRTALTALTGEE
jgi:HEAT repeat protein